MRFYFPVGQLSRLALAVCLVLSVFGTNDVQTAQARGQINLTKFDRLNTTSGWILLDQHLFWTSDAGRSWHEISPSVPIDARIQDVKFIDSNHGWLLWTLSNPDGSLNFQLAHTVDNGKSWTDHSLSLFEVGDIASFAEKAEMGWFDSQSGWISVKQTSGSNFSIGTLFTTSDGGVSWHRLTLPVADQIYFSDPRNGWATGGPSGDQIFTTSNGGATWTRNMLSDPSNDIQTKVYPPFVFHGQGLLVATAFGPENYLNVYSRAKSEQWSSIGQLKLDVQPGQLGLSILDAHNFVATIPGTPSIVRMENGRLSVRNNEDGLSASIVSLDMISLENGWAESVDSNCVSASSSDRESASVSCVSTTRLLQTEDGGITWRTINLPSVQPGAAALSSSDALTSSSITASGNTAVFVGQGFDRCEIPTLSQMQTWSTSSPYKAVNLYVGGSSRACNNTALIASYLFLLHQQGWDFIPTWVGPQAPCTGFGTRMSSDANTAYTQGVNEANLAVDRLAQLGLTGPDKTGSVIYYDIENYGTNTACRSAVNSFMNGWVSQIRARGNTAGVYGSTLCNTGLSDFLTITNVPDVMWAARWYHNLGQGFYDPNASVWNLGSCIPNSVWANHQRVRQYEGDHNETWGNLTLEIDSDVLDGVVAIPYDYPYVSSIIRKDANPTAASVVNFTVTFSKTVTGVNAADFRLTTTGVTNASISTISGSGTTYNVAVNTGQGSGTIRLDIVDNDSIQDAANNSLGGAGTGNGNFNSGAVYTVTKFVNIRGNAGIAGATLSYLNGTTQTATSDGIGNYSITVPYNWTGEVTPNKHGYTFTPASRSYSNLQSNQTAQNYTVEVCSSCAAINVKIGAGSQGDYSLPSGESMVQSYGGVAGGPVVVKSSNGAKIIASMLELRRSNVTVNQWTGIAQVMGMQVENLSDKYVFPRYTNVDITKYEVIPIANYETFDTNVTIKVGSTDYGPYLIPAGTSYIFHQATEGGPVLVSSDNSARIIASLYQLKRAGTTGRWNGQSEMMGIPPSPLSDTYVLPYYDYTTPGLLPSLNIANTDSIATDIAVSIGGMPMGTYPMDGGTSQVVSYAGVAGGPVVVKSSNGAKIIASMLELRRSDITVNQWTGIAQVMGVPVGQLSDRYMFPRYTNQDATKYEVIPIANYETFDTNVTVKVGNNNYGPFAVAHGTSYIFNQAIEGGPVLVSSDNGARIIASLYQLKRAGTTGRWNGQSEMMGVPPSRLSDTSVLPYYDYTTPGLLPSLNIAQ